MVGETTKLQLVVFSNALGDNSNPLFKIKWDCMCSEKTTKVTPINQAKILDRWTESKYIGDILLQTSAIRDFLVSILQNVFHFTVLYFIYPFLLFTSTSTMPWYCMHILPTALAFDRQLHRDRHTAHRSPFQNLEWLEGSFLVSVSVTSVILWPSDCPSAPSAGASSAWRWLIKSP